MEERKRDWSALFEEASEVVKQWRASHPRATFAEIETTVKEEMARVRAKVVQDLVHESASREWSGREKADRPKCPACGTGLHANGQYRRQLVTDHEQVIELRRGHGRCPECGTTVFPPG
jgi:vacuolar-type H+-ATPase subunit E/Vma4